MENIVEDCDLIAIGKLIRIGIPENYWIFRENAERESERGERKLGFMATVFVVRRKGRVVFEHYEAFESFVSSIHSYIQSQAERERERGDFLFKIKKKENSKNVGERERGIEKR